MDEARQRAGIVERKNVSLAILVDHDYCIVLYSLFLRIDSLWRWKSDGALSIDSHYIFVTFLIDEHLILLVV